MKKSPRKLLTKLQAIQKVHDERAHQDILAQNLYDRLKHMVLHFFKYASRVSLAKKSRNIDALKLTVLDSIIICLASANSLKIYLDDYVDYEEGKTLNELCLGLSREFGVGENEEVFDKFIDDILMYGGSMAKVMESTDHMESGNPRAEMANLIPKLFLALLGYVTPLGIDVEESMAARFKKIEGSFVL